MGDGKKTKSNIRAPKTSKRVLKTPWFFIEEEKFKGRGMGLWNPFYRIVEPPGVVVFATTPQNKIIVVRQYRPAIRRFTLEIPAGGIDRKEAPAAAAKRELYEEAGYRAETLVGLNKELYMMPNRTTAACSFFWAKGAVRDKAFKPKENIQVVLMSLGEFKKSFKSGKILQMGGLAAFLLWRWNLEKK